MRLLTCSFAWMLVLSAGAIAAASDDQQPVVLASLVSGEASISPDSNVVFDETLPGGNSVYSLMIDFDPSWWEKHFSSPDLVVVIESEGGQRFLVPEIEREWDYSRKIFNFRCPTLIAGSDGVIRLYSDHTESDYFWKRVLETRISWNAGASGTVAPPGWLKKFACLEFVAGAGGEFQLLNPATSEHLVLHAPTPIASAGFTVPSENVEMPWELSTVFTKDGATRGTVQFRHWQTRRESLLSSAISSAPAGAPWWLAIGTVVTIVAAVAGVALRNRQPAEATPSNVTADSLGATNSFGAADDPLSDMYSPGIASTNDLSSSFAEPGPGVFDPSPSLDEPPATATRSMFDPD